MRALLTGATGFVGGSLLGHLSEKGTCSVRLAVRRHAEGALAAHDQITVGDLGPANAWGEALREIDTVIHLAARVHVTKEEVKDSLAAFRRTNVAGTVNLAWQAARAGVKRFVFVSSVKVNGEGSWERGTRDRVYRETDPAAPMDNYGISKYEAEQGLWQIAKETGMEVVIIRPPLVYGPGVRANFRSLLRLVESGMVLPLGAVDNCRSFVAADNLADFIRTCSMHPRAANEVFFVSDGEDLSTSDLIRRIADAMGRRTRLLPIPMGVLYFGAGLLGKRDLARRLLGSMRVDIAKAREYLNWTPPVSVAMGLGRTVANYPRLRQ